MNRTADIRRDTKETQIRVRVNLDGSGQAKLASNWITGELTRRLNGQDLSIEQSPVSAETLAQLVTRISDSTISNSAARLAASAISNGAISAPHSARSDSAASTLPR